MSAIGCTRASLLLQKRASGLDEAEQLRLEEHLSGCESCSRDARALALLRDLALQAGSPLAAGARERAVLRAISAGEPVRPARRPRALPALAAAAAVAMAAAVTGLFFWLPKSGPQPGSPVAGVQSARAPNLAPAADRVLSGAISAGGREIPAGGGVKSGVVLESRSGARLDLGFAQLELRADTRIKWMKERSSVELLAGALQAEVKTGYPFQVVTDRFLVLVAGTRFEVSRLQVKVHRGRVRVLSREGDALLAELGPGESWKHEPTAVAGSATAGPQTASAPGERRQAPLSGRALLALARRHLSEARTGEARRMVAAALGRNLSREERAEAETLLAECRLVAGDRAAAARRYLRVASRYPELGAAENALFAAARLRAESGEAAAARTLFERYIQQYPNGRFQTEVNRRLRSLRAR
jgi:hypothetical protein